MPTSPTQHVTFEFCRLSSPVPGVARSFGRAAIGFDGRGRWWVESIHLEGTRPGESGFVPKDTEFFTQFSVALEISRAEEIATRINHKLRAGGAYMALFGEHMPNNAEGLPPRLRRPAAAYA